MDRLRGNKNEVKNCMLMRVNREMTELASNNTNNNKSEMRAAKFKLNFERSRWRKILP